MFGFIAEESQKAVLRPAETFQSATEIGDPSKDDALLKGFHHGVLRGFATERGDGLRVGPDFPSSKNDRRGPRQSDA